MKSLRNLSALLILGLSLTAGACYGTTFSYAYTFGDGLVVSGKLNGTQKGNFVENVSDVSVLFNGSAVPGIIYASSYDGMNYLKGPVVSFDALQNNFVFATSDLAGGDWGYESLFYMLNASVFADTALALSNLGSGYASQDFPTSSESWSLKVPDGGSTLALLSLVLLALAAARRRTSAALAVGNVSEKPHDA